METFSFSFSNPAEQREREKREPRGRENVNGERRGLWDGQEGIWIADKKQIWPGFCDSNVEHILRGSIHAQKVIFQVEADILSLTLRH